MTTIHNGGNDHPVHMGGTRRTPQAPPRSGLGVNPSPTRVPAGPDSTGSSPEVSAQGGRFLSLRARLEALEATRTERVERLRQLVAEGRYQPDSEATAAAMLKDPATAAALGVR